MKQITLKAIPVITLVTAALLVGCGQNSTAHNTEASSDLLEEYYEVLIDTTDADTILSFIDKNIESSSPSEANEMINGVLGFYEYPTDADYDRLSSYSSYLSKDMSEFILLMSEEAKSPLVKDRKIIAPLSDLLQKCVVWENQLKAYPGSMSSTYSYEQLTEYLTCSITGGYDPNLQNDNIYLASDGKTIDGKALDAYKAFIEKFPESDITPIIKNYLDILEQNNHEMNENIKNFYLDIYETIIKTFAEYLNP